MSWRRATALLLASGALLLLLGSATASASAAPSGEAAGGRGATRSARARASAGGGVGVGGVGSRMRRFPLLLPQVPLDVLDDEDESLFEANKRQMSDDYGHMRFGKRGGENDFAEYGHMRFGRAAA